MPSTLYESVKASVVEYAQLRKMNKREEDKMLFRWKLITIFLAIVFIVLVGLFSQFLKNYTSLPPEQHDYSYIVPLMNSINQQFMGSLAEANNLVKGVAAGAQSNSEYLQYNSVAKLYSQPLNQNYTKLTEAIKEKDKLLFIFSTQGGDLARFGLYADTSDGRYSTIFNIVNGTTMNYNVNGCFLFSNINSELTIFDTFKIKNDSPIFYMDVSKPSCFNKITEDDGRNELTALTGLGGTWPYPLTGVGLEVYQLYLNKDL